MPRPSDMTPTPISKPAQAAICLCFLLLVIVPHIMELFGSGGSTASMEKRENAKTPDACLILKSFSEFARQFESYYSDSFGLRDRLIYWNALLRLGAFDESPAGMKVRIGREGWLFYAEDRVLEDYANVIPFNSEDLEKIGRGLEERRAWLEGKGTKLFIIVPPNKHSIYSEYLPLNIHKIGKESRLDQVKAYLERYPKLEFVDVREAFFKAKPEQRLYHKTDTHWNEYGAFLAYKELIDRIGLHFPAIKKLSLDDFTVNIARTRGGDLAGLLSLSDRLVEDTITLVPKTVPMAQAAPSPFLDPLDGKNMIVREVDNPHLPKAVVFHDSFTKALVPFLSESFRRVVFVPTLDFMPELIEREKPDVVIIECVERFLGVLLKGNPPQVRAALHDSR
jgi:alginate O-acetyltransferase complex protein AlgJ